MVSYYEVLGVEPDADAERIREAYITAVRGSRAPPSRRALPPLGGPDRRFDEAYAVLGEPDRRRRYDELRLLEGSGGNAELLALLAVIGETGGIPTAEETLARIRARPPRAPRSRPVPARAPTPVAAAVAGGPQWQRTAAIVFVVATITGIAAGLALTPRSREALRFAVDGCVSLAEDEATAVLCGSSEADARISAIVEDTGSCPPSPLGTLDLGERGVACLVEDTPPED